MKHSFRVHIESGESRLPLDALFDADATVTFKIDYPLTTPYIHQETHTDGSGWTQAQFIAAVRRAYFLVYAAEGDDPGHVPGMLNRARSHGPFGIWGHDLGDLYLEGAIKQDDGSWQLEVGS